MRAKRRYLISVVPVVVAGCLGQLFSPHSVAGPNVIGTWKDSTARVMLTVALDTSSCQFGCGGFVTGGAYRDSAINVHGTFQDQGNAYYMTPPSGSPSYSSPLPGWYISISPVDTAHANIVITFNGTFSTATSIAGYVKFTSGATSDSVMLTLAKQ